AFAEHQWSAERYAKNTTSPRDRTTWGRAYLVELGLRAGKSDAAEATQLLRDLASLGTVPKGHDPDGIATARRAGLFEAFVFGAERSDITGEAEHLDHRATLAFQRGEVIDATKHVASRWIQFSRWLAVLDGKQVDTRLAALEAEHPIPAARAY